MSAFASLPPRLREPLQAIATALAYALAGWLALRLSPAPGYAAPLYPAAGVALACTLRFGRSALVGIAIGAFFVASATLHAVGKPAPNGLAIAAVVALGAALQAGVGTVLVRRFVARPLTLSEPRDVALFFGLGAPLACLVGASIATAALGAGGVVERAALTLTWWTWWSGDTMGVLIAAPVVLTLIGRPRADWSARRLTVGLPLALAALLMALAIAQVARWDDDRSRALFEREANDASNLLAQRLEQPLDALQALRGVFAASPSMSRDGLRRAARHWLSTNAEDQGLAHSVWSVGYAEWLARAEVAAFERRQRAEGAAEFTVFDAKDQDAAATSADDAVMAIAQVEPMANNARVLGLNQLSLAPLREAIERARRTDSPAATAGLRLTQALPSQRVDDRSASPGGNRSPARSDESVVGLLHVLYRGEPTTMGERLAATTSLVFVTLRPQVVLDEIRGSLPAFVDICLIDTDPSATRRVLAGRSDCMDLPADTMLHVRSLSYAGRSWDVRVTARPEALAVGVRTGLLPFSIAGLFASAMLGALLLTVTGRTRRIESAVLERTADLEREIRERARTESALRESEQRFRNIINNVPIGVVYTDLAGQVMQANPRFCEMVGYGPDELASMTAQDYTHPDDWPQEAALLQRLLVEELPLVRRRKRYIAGDGRTLWVQSSVSLLRDAQGKPHRIVAVVEDITEHLRLQEAERAREVAESSNRAKSEFLSRMSHELRTPLNAMLGFAQLLELDQRHPLADAQRPWVAQIQGAGWHLLEMINDVLDLSRIESGTLRLHPEPLELPPLFDSTRSMIDGEAQRRGITVTQQIDEGAALVLGDATRVKQILTNLLSNAVKYNNERGRIHVTASTCGVDQVEIAVTDTGLGMTAEQLAGLFQPFNRLGRERSVQEGTGIGLVISQRLAELMGGTLRARSTEGVGSSFIVTLPRVVDADTVRSDLDELYTTSSGYHTRIVHYVEDNETNVEVMRGILAQRQQVQLDVSVTGLDALAAIRQRRPDLILLDMHLPDIDGMELLRHLKSSAATIDIPVVVVSADALPARVEAALEAGARRYLTKPVSVAELLAAVDEALEKADTKYD